MVNNINVNKKEKVNLFLAAINQITETAVVSAEEKEVSGKDFITWGANNKYPNYLWDLYSNCSTLQTIINTTGNYVCGDDIVCNISNFTTVNKKGETIKDIISRLVIDYLIFGSFAIQVIRNVNGGIAELYWVDVNKLRSDEKNEVFFYSEDWSKSYGRVKTVIYPKFGKDDKNATSIFYYKGNKARGVYGVPIWSAAIKNVQIDCNITDFHFNEINNNFMTSKLISFNNGIPNDEQKAEIEHNLTEKFAGAGNAARVMLSFSDSKENAPEVIDLGSDNFPERYASLEKRNKEQIYCSFSATPVLFGLVTEANGFATNEYRDSYKLFNKTVVAPIQDVLVDTFNKIFGTADSITITPFTITFDNN